MLADVFDRKMAQRTKPDLGPGDPGRAGRVRQVFDSVHDIANQCRLMHVRQLPPPDAPLILNPDPRLAADDPLRSAGRREPSSQ